MSETYIRFIDKGGARKPWNVNISESVVVGAEGEKIKGELELAHRTVDGFFLKEAKDKEDAFQQRKKWEIIKNAGINTTDIFRIAEDSNGKIWMVMEDLSQNGDNWVVSGNNADILNSPDYWSRVISISKETKDRLVKLILDMAMAAGKKGIAFSNPQKLTNPLMVSVSRNKSSEVKVEIYAQDFGIDMDFSEPGEDLQRENLQSAVIFLSDTLGIFTRIPEDHTAYRLSTFFSEQEWISFLNQEIWFRRNLKQIGAL